MQLCSFNITTLSRKPATFSSYYYHAFSHKCVAFFLVMFWLFSHDFFPPILLTIINFFSHVTTFFSNLWLFLSLCWHLAKNLRSQSPYTADVDMQSLSSADSCCRSSVHRRTSPHSSPRPRHQDGRPRWVLQEPSSRSQRTSYLSSPSQLKK